MTDWDAELKKIDKQLESISDSALIPAPSKGAAPAAKAKVVEQRETTKTWPAFLRLALATALAAGILFWPYPSRGGFGLAGYGAAVAAVTIDATTGAKEPRARWKRVLDAEESAIGEAWASCLIRPWASIAFSASSRRRRSRADNRDANRNNEPAPSRNTTIVATSSCSNAR